MWESPLHTALPVNLAHFVLQALLICSKTLSCVFFKSFMLMTSIGGFKILSLYANFCVKF